ncbi:hypothetical protein [Erythrobacter sp. WG]|uniref:hypothetical protein n=1 Tax=Erythrobacter sp. WG TaxID=2985510 RepID=UPI002271FC6A|nr:hypothetical protein [Erythrobacter sp. WG]MCX9146582.1 hypothetical protein [Erythrobacter sp. WG]
MWDDDGEPDPRGSFLEIAAALALAALVAPGLIWWAATIITIMRDAWEAFR